MAEPQPPPDTSPTAPSPRAARPSARRLRRAVSGLAALAALAAAPSLLAARDARAYLDVASTGAPDAAPFALARTAASRTATREALEVASFGTGSEFFDGEWTFGTAMMTAMGLGQLALARPERASELAPALDAALDRLLEPRARAFDRAAWGTDALATLDGSERDAAGVEGGHVAYLGYLNLALELRRLAIGPSRWDALGDRVSVALDRRLRATGFVRTYPRQTFPVDVASALGSLGLHERVTGTSHEGARAAYRAAVAARGRDPATGLLVQRLGEPGADGLAHDDVARGSGTLLGAYFLAFGDPPLAASLYDAAKAHLLRGAFGVAAFREVAAGPSARDIDSGPVVLGLGLSATGFGLGAARALDDRATFTRLYATTHLFGLPVDDAGGRAHATGGAIGDAILLAMLTAPTPADLARGPGAKGSGS